MGAKTSIQTTVYATFRGADFSTDPSLVESYRSPLCTNIVADAGGMPEKRRGWRTIHQLSGRIHGLFYGVFEQQWKTIVHAGTKLYEWTDGTEPVELMSGLPEHRSRGVSLGGKLWIVTGGGFLVYDGATAAWVRDTENYVPTTIITRTPTGGGASYEDVNMMTPYRKNAFQTDGEATEFLLDSPVDPEGTVRVWVWDEELAAGEFTVDRENGKVTLTEAPAKPIAGQADGLVVQFPHTVEGYTDRIDKCTIITTYGVGTDDRIVVSGNPEFANTDWTSALNDPSYIPDLSYANMGSEDVPIMGYCRVGSALGIVKADNGQDTTIYLRSAEVNEAGEAVFTLRQAMAGVGAVSKGSFVTLLDDPLFLSRTGIYALSVTNQSGERVTQNRSFYVNPKLIEETLSQGEAVEWNGQYLLSFPNGHAYVMDGRQKKSYRSAALGDYVYECYYWENIPAVCWLPIKSGERELLYFGTEDGRICKINSDLDGMERFNDDGAPIDTVWATKYDDDGSPSRLKTIQKRGCCVTIKPYSRSSATVYFRSDKTGGTEMQVSRSTMDIFDWEDIDFERFTFNTDSSPAEVFFNRKLKNYKRLQIIIRNKEINEGFGVFQITKHFVTGNFAKNTGGGSSRRSDVATEEEVRAAAMAAFDEVFGDLVDESNIATETEVTEAAVAAFEEVFGE